MVPNDPHDPPEETDFGQSRFGHPDLTNFGQHRFWPIHSWPFHLDLGVCVCVMVGPKGWAQTQKKSGPEGWGPKGGEPNISRFFVPSPALPFSLFLSLSGCLLVEFWGCF